MARLDIDINDKLDARFRGIVYKRMGMRRGNITIAVEAALRTWMKKDIDGPADSPKVKQTQASELVVSAQAS